MQHRQKDASSKELTLRLNKHYNSAHEQAGIPPEGCPVCENLKKLILEAEERERRSDPDNPTTS